MKSFTFIETDDGVNFKRIIIIIITDIMDIRIYEVLGVLSGMTEEDRTTSIKRYSNVPIFFDHLSGRSNEVFASIPSQRQWVICLSIRNILNSMEGLSFL